MNTRVPTWSKIKWIALSLALAALIIPAATANAATILNLFPDTSLGTLNSVNLNSGGPHDLTNDAGQYDSEYAAGNRSAYVFIEKQNVTAPAAIAGTDILENSLVSSFLLHYDPSFEGSAGAPVNGTFELFLNSGEQMLGQVRSKLDLDATDAIYGGSAGVTYPTGFSMRQGEPTDILTSAIVGSTLTLTYDLNAIPIGIDQLRFFVGQIVPTDNISSIPTPVAVWMALPLLSGAFVAMVYKNRRRAR